MKTTSHKGVGLNLRLENIDEILSSKPELDILEVIVENWFSPGPHHKKLEVLRADYEISFHCVGMNIAGVSELNLNHIKRVKELRDKFEPIHVSDHLCMTAHNGVQHHDLLPVPFTEVYLKNTVERIHLIQEVIGEEILLENLSYYIQYKDCEMSEMDFFNHVLKKTDAKMLFDLNNIWVNAKNLKIKLEEEIEKVPWNLVKEVHLAGPELRKGIFVDTHGSSIHSEVHALLKKYKNILADKVVIYERDNNIVDLAGLMKEVQLIKEALL